MRARARAARPNGTGSERAPASPPGPRCGRRRRDRTGESTDDLSQELRPRNCPRRVRAGRAHPGPEAGQGIIARRKVAGQNRGDIAACNSGMIKGRARRPLSFLAKCVVRYLLWQTVTDFIAVSASVCEV